MDQITKTSSNFCTIVTNCELEKDLLAQVFPQFRQAIVKQKKKLDQPLSYFLGIFFMRFSTLGEYLCHIHQIGLLLLFQEYGMGSTSIF